MSTFVNSIDHIFIINLKHRTDRKQLMIKKLKGLGFPTRAYTFIEATDRLQKSWALALTEILAIPIMEKDVLNFISAKYRRKLKSSTKIKLKAQGEIAVFLSHFRIWNIVSKLKYGSYLVLEDDAVPTPLIKSSTSLLKKAISMRIPFLYLGYLFPESKQEAKPINDISNTLISCFVEALHSYIITPDFGLLIKKSLVQNSFSPLPINEPVDHFVPNFLIDNKIPFYIFKKPLFDQDTNLGTDIQGTMDKDQNLFQNLRS